MVSICLVGCRIHFLPSVSGDVVLTRSIFEALNKRHDVTLITTVQKSIMHDNIESLTNLGYDNVITLPSKDTRYLDALACYNKLIDFHGRSRFDIIHLFEMPVYSVPLFYHLAKKIDSKMLYHVFMPATYFNLKSSLLSRFNDTIIVTSPYLLKFFKAKKGPPVYLVHPPVDTNTYAPNPNTHEKPFTILYIGALLPERFPLEEVLSAFKLLCENDPKVKMKIVVGPRPIKRSLALISRLKDKLTDEKLRNRITLMHETLSIKEKIDLINQASVVIFPFDRSITSVVDPPLTLLEAMSCGRTVVASKALSFPYIIKDEHNGFLYARSSVAELFKVLKKAIYSNNKDYIRTNARETIIKQMDTTKVLKQLTGIYKSLANS